MTGAAGPPSDAPTRAGFVALIGAPNAGKSTLVNQLVGTKVAIVSPKVQTTRARLLGIALAGPSQLVLVDTPGLFEPKRRLERAMVSAAWQGAADADLTVLLVDAAAADPVEATAAIRDRLAERQAAGAAAPILALNKIDRLRRERLLALAQTLNQAGRFADTFMISALTGDGVADLKAALAARLPEGPWLYPEDEVTDLPMRLMAAEITREKLFNRLHQELPYAITVETESWQAFDDGSTAIGQVIYVQRDSQKAIVLGRRGAAIKHVGMDARRELEEILEGRVHLKLFVKVRSNWVDDPDRYAPWGLDYNA